MGRADLVAASLCISVLLRFHICMCMQMLDSMSNMMNQIDTADTSIAAQARDDVISGQNSDRLYDTGEIIEVFANLLQNFDGIDGAEVRENSSGIWTVVKFSS